MNLRDKTYDELEINLTPLIDVVFLLLIFFMVSTTFIHESEITLNLPEASKNAQEDKTQALSISIDSKGRYYLNGVALVNTQMETLKRAMSAAAGVDQPQVVISADGNATHQNVINVMDAARQLGLLKITFTTRIRDESE
jgi:biopolymer transport protein ExbD